MALYAAITVGKEEEIRALLEEGHTPKTLIERGFAKSTVYKILSTTRTFLVHLRNSEWVIENVKIDKARHLPGEQISIVFDLTNLSSRDLYLLNVGVQTEWMITTEQKWYWYSQTINDVLKPMQKRTISLIIPIPIDIQLGEYELRFGFQSQYLPVTSYEDQVLEPKFSMPYILHIKYPLRPEKIFLSHSIRDKYLITGLQKSLDKVGFEVILGEDIQIPGALLDAKFKHFIESSAIFVAFVTHSAIFSKWVRLEIEHAIAMRKPMVLLKDRSLKIDLPYEWVEFDKNAPQEVLFEIVMSALKNIRSDQNWLNSPLVKTLSIALVAFLAGLSLSRL